MSFWDVIKDLFAKKPTYTLSQGSIEKLVGVKEPLVDVVKLAITLSPVNFIIVQGLRTQEQEAQFVAQGKSETEHSRHITGCAVDFAAVVDGEVAWQPISLYHDIADSFIKAAKQLDVPIVWGGSWTTFKDYDHIELDRKTYP